MEAIGATDPGPMTLKVGAPDIAERLAWALARVPGLSGINNHEGSKFSTDAASLDAGGAGAGGAASVLFRFPHHRRFAGSCRSRTCSAWQSAGRDVFLDNVLTRSRDPTAAATTGGQGRANRASPSPSAIRMTLTLRVLAAWLAEDHGVQLVPLSEAIRLKTERNALVAAE